MTIVSQIITDAFRQSNLIALRATPTEEEQVEGLRYLNRLLKSVFGNEAGDPFTSFPIGSKDISRPAGYPWWNDVPDNDWFVPQNTRLMLNIDRSLNLYLHPDPDDGARFAIVDVAKNLSNNPITVYGNGRTIEGEPSVTAQIDGDNYEWFYRSDLANWIKYVPLGLEDTFPFPEEFDDYFITMLAMRLNPSYGKTLDEQSAMVLRRSRSQLRSRYTSDIPVRSEIALFRLSKMAADRDEWGNSYWLYNPNSMFDKGWPW